jgi:hypothetical protein
LAGKSPYPQEVQQQLAREASSLGRTGCRIVAEKHKVAWTTVRRWQREQGLETHDEPSSAGDWSAPVRWTATPAPAPVFAQAERPLAPGGIKRYLFWPDTHVPYQDERAVRLLLDFARDFQPHELVIKGDLVDLGPVSRYEQDPLGEVNIQAQFDAAGALLDRMREAVGGGCRISFEEGNHETRINKYVLRNAAKLAWLKRDGESVLGVPFMLGLKRRGITWVPGHDAQTIHGTISEHGDCAAKESAATARAMVTKRRASTISVHTHRLGLYCYTGKEPETVVGIEGGCLIDRDSDAASYAKYPNWQLGFVVGEHHAATGLFQPTPILIRHYSFIWAGKLYAA